MNNRLSTRVVTVTGDSNYLTKILMNCRVTVDGTRRDWIQNRTQEQIILNKIQWEDIVIYNTDTIRLMDSQIKRYFSTRLYYYTSVVFYCDWVQEVYMYMSQG